MKKILWLWLLFQVYHLSAQNSSDTEKINYKNLSFQEVILLADQGDPKAMFDIGKRYLTGQGGAEKNMPLAVSWSEKAVSNGELNAKYELGLYYLSADQEDIKQKGKDYLMSSADSGSAKSQVFLYHKHLKGEDPFSKDVDLAIKYLFRAAHSGSAEAEAEMGDLLLHGRFFKKDVYAAVPYIKRAAHQGNPKGLYLAGYLFKRGIGVEQNDSIATRLWQRSARRKYVHASYALGFMLYKGLGVEQDYDKAFRLMRIAAIHEDRSAMAMLGLCYAFGHGVEKDDIKAEKWLRKSKKGARPNHKNHIIYENFKEGKLTAQNVEQVGEEFLEDFGELILPVNYEKIVSTIPITEDITGKWSGLMAIYDWSGKNIQDQYRVDFRLRKQNNMFIGNLSYDTVNVRFVGRLVGNKLKLVEGSLKRKNFQGANMILNQEFKSMTLDMTSFAENQTLSANIQSYISEYKEKGRPISMIVKKKKADEYLIVRKNNQTGEIKIKLRLDTEAYSEIRVLNAMNMNIHSTIHSGNLNMGIHRFSDQVHHYSPGVYIVAAVVGDQKYTGKFIIK